MESGLPHRKRAILATGVLLFVGLAGPFSGSSWSEELPYEVLHDFSSPPVPWAGVVEVTPGSLFGTTPFGGANGLGMLFRLNADGSGFATLRDFDWSSGSNPYSRLLLAADGALYGTTARGGVNGVGVVFRVLADGSAYTDIHDFNGADGALPYGALVQGSDGTLYGTTTAGGAHTFGTAFRISPDGSGFALLHEFAQTDGAEPFAGLLLKSDGRLYGATSSGGDNTAGTLFGLATDGAAFATLHHFSGPAGPNHEATPIEGQDGLLYGVTALGVYQAAADGSAFAIINDLTSSNGRLPSGPLLQTPDGWLYGSTTSDSPNGLGIIFRLQTDGSALLALHSFDGSNGATPDGGLIQGSDGRLYGTTRRGSGPFSGSVFGLGTDGSGFAALRGFNAIDGSGPASLLRATDGNFYGTTRQQFGPGTAFRVTPDGGVTILHVFDPNDPRGLLGPALAQGPDGALYGTTDLSVFKLNTDGSGFLVLHDFTSNDGSMSRSPLLIAADGALYGMMASGGTGGDGTLFKLNRDGSGFTVLVNFNGYNGQEPLGGLVQGSDGRLYGTTTLALSPLFGLTHLVPGLVFGINTDGTSFQILHTFDSATDGAEPQGSLVERSDGMLYGTSRLGGTRPGSATGCGVVFKLNKDGSGFSHVIDLDGPGCYPSGGLLDYGGDLYGTSATVFRITPAPFPSLAVLHTFTGDDGSGPGGPLVPGDGGMLYGTAHGGGPSGGGVVFRLQTSPNIVSAGWRDIVEGNAAPHSEGFVVSLAHPSAKIVTVHYSTRDGSAVAGSDYAAASGALVFQPGETAKTILTAINGDTVFEADETFFIDLSSVVGGARPLPGWERILNDDSPPTLSIGNTTVVEGSGNASTAGAFTVSLSAATETVTKVDYSFSDGTAREDQSDYVGNDGTLTIPPGALNGVIPFAVFRDDLAEPDETFFVTLSNPSGATILAGQGQCTILNDDAFPTVSVTDASVSEGDSGVTVATFAVTLSKPNVDATTIDYAASDGTATAASGDYTPVSGTLTIPAGSTSGSITVSVQGDLVAEPDETFGVVLSNPVRATLGDSQAVGTIVNDDVPQVFSFAAAHWAVREAAGFATITVKRTNGGALGGSVRYDTFDGTATSGPGGDYGATSGILSFGENQTLASFTVPVADDTLQEGPETVLLRLSDPTSTHGGELDAESTAVLTITDSDVGGRVQLASANYRVAEGAGSVTLTVRRLGGTASGVSVHYATSPLTATGGGTDYGDVTGDITFAGSGTGATTQTLTIPITQDLIPEGSEGFTVTLSDPEGGAVLGTPTVAAVTIVDDEPTVEFGAASYAAKETQQAALITVTRSGPLADPATVAYATGDASDTATAGEDYQAASGTLTFAAGVAARHFLVPLHKDTLVEDDETVTLTLSGLSGPPGIALGAKTTATLTIRDDDATPTLEFSAPLYRVSEALAKAVVTVTRKGNASHRVTVDYDVVGGSASNGGADYDLPLPGTLTFEPGVLRRSVTVPIVNDALDEGTETVDLQLSAPHNLTDPDHAALGAVSAATLLITDNEPTVQFTAAEYSVKEAAESLWIQVRRLGAATEAATVQCDVVGGTAVRDTGSGGDYSVQAPAALTFDPGQRVRGLRVTLNPNTKADGPKTVELALSAAVGVELGTPSTTAVTIKDDDVAGRVQFTSASYSVSESGGEAFLTVSRVGGASSEATVHYSTADGTATAPTSYDTTSGTLTFGLNETTRTIVVPVRGDGVTGTGARSLEVTLDTPGNGLALGAVSTTTLWIVDADQ